MVSAELTAWIGAAVGIVIGLSGGLVGTYCAIRNTNGPRERAYAIRSSVVCWAFISLFLVALFLLPPDFRVFVWIPYAILLALGIVNSNRTQQTIRQTEAGKHDTEQIEDSGST